MDHRPYPTAPDPTKPSFARSGAARASARSRRPATAPTPATVWAAGVTSVDPAALWPPSILATVVTSFSDPGDCVALLPWPATIDPGSGSALHRGADPDECPEMTGALAVIEELNRDGLLLRVGASAAAATAAPTQPRPGHHTHSCGEQVLDVAGGLGEVSDRPDLIVVSATPQQIVEGGAGPGGGRVIDEVALVAAQTLRVGGIFVVLTHCAWTDGELLDPGGLIVAAGQCADLLYLQHIVALHLPVHAGRFAPDPRRSHDTAEATSQRETTPGRGAHRRIHSDVYVFAQPHDHAPLPSLEVPPEPVDGAVHTFGTTR